MAKTRKVKALKKVLKLTCSYCETEKELDVTEGIPLKTVCPGCKRPFKVEQFVRR